MSQRIVSRRRNGDEVIPSARRLMKSLRDMGYDFASAIADLVDNSIEAGATLVAIDIEFDGNDSWVRIADNGAGMSAPELKEAMRYGAERDYDDDDLGKFGLGLKTASLSQCQRLSVACRTNPARADIVAFCWDLAHIDKTNRWEIIRLERGGLGPSIREPLKETTGTVVLWEKLDRILGYQQPYGESARKRLSAMCRELEVHLAMVFHRFLSGQVKRRKLKILVNGNDVIPWDPFARSEANTKSLTPVVLPLEHEGVKGEVTLEPFVLPPEDGFSSPEAFKRASGPLKWNQQQGFYVYRAGRLIQSGGWCRLRTTDEHIKLARIALSFSPTLDEAFKINVAKMRVQLPPQIRDAIEKAVTPVIRMADAAYRKSPPKSTSSLAAQGNASGRSSDQPSPHSPIAPAPASAAAIGNLGSPQEKLWSLQELQSAIEQLADPEERPLISKLFDRLRTRIRS